MEVNYHGLQQRGDSSMFSKFLHGAGFIFRAQYSIRFQHNFFFIILFLLFTENSRGYSRVLWMAITASCEKCSLQYAVGDQWLIILELVLSYRSLNFLEMHIRILFVSSCFIIRKDVVISYALDIYISYSVRKQLIYYIQSYLNHLVGLLVVVRL